jgi:hypothetical protein
MEYKNSMKIRIATFITFIFILSLAVSCGDSINGVVDHQKTLLHLSLLEQTQSPTLAQKMRGIWIIGGSADLAGTAIVPQIDMYDPVTNTWYPDVAAGASGSYTPTAFSMAASVGGRIYVMGGATSSIDPESTVHEYNIASNSWILKAPIPVTLMGASAYTQGNYIYLIGGTTAANTTANVVTTHYRFDPAGAGGVGLWTTVPPAAYATARASMAVANFDGMVVYSGGRIAGGGASNLNNIYIINSDTYIAGVVLTSARAGMAYAGYAGSNGTYFFLVGGASAFTAATAYFGLTSITYAPQASSFIVYLPPSTAAAGILTGTTHPSFQGTVTGLVFASAAVSPYNGSASVDPTLYVFGGIKTTAGPTTNAATNEVYSITANGLTAGVLYASGSTWAAKTAMPRARFGHSAIVIQQ